MSIGYHLGIWEVEDRPNERNSLHLVNLSKYAWMIMSQDQVENSAETDSTLASDRLVQDMLWSYRRTPDMVLPEWANIWGKVVTFKGINAGDMVASETFRRKNFTQIQTDLMLLAFNGIHALLQNSGAKVFHTFVHTTQDWYIEEAGALLKQVFPTLDNAYLVGRFPKRGVYDMQLLNEHSGGHYTPEFNEYWAEQAVQLMRTRGVFEGS